MSKTYYDLSYSKTNRAYSVYDSPVDLRDYCISTDCVSVAHEKADFIGAVGNKVNYVLDFCNVAIH